MFYWLADLSGTISVFNVFRYLTVRTGGSMITALIFVFLCGPWIIDHLRVRRPPADGEGEDCSGGDRGFAERGDDHRGAGEGSQRRPGPRHQRQKPDAKSSRDQRRWMRQRQAEARPLH